MPRHVAGIDTGGRNQETDVRRFEDVLAEKPEELPACWTAPIEGQLVEEMDGRHDVLPEDPAGGLGNE